MRRFAALLILLASGCDNGHPPPRPSPQNGVQPAAVAPQPARAASSAPASNAAQAAPEDAPPQGDSGVAGLSPAQRRAYELGYRDCSHGRYAPENHLEAYRIGCGAAHDHMEGARPQG
jgi:hypothetical protein